MESGFFEYVCDFFDQIEEKITSAKGVVYADSFSDAMYELEQYYGKNNIENVKIQGLEPCNVYPFEDSISFSLTIN